MRWGGNSEEVRDGGSLCIHRSASMLLCAASCAVWHVTNVVRRVEESDTIHIGNILQGTKRETKRRDKIR